MDFLFSDFKNLLIALGYDKSINENTNIVEDEELDSTETSEVITEVKKKYGVFITPAMLHDKTLDELYKYIKENKKS